MTRPSPSRPLSPARPRRLRGVTLLEAIVALGVSGLLFAMVTTQLVESSKLSVRVTTTLEHSRNSRELLDRLTADLRSAQIVRLYPGFTDRTAVARDGETGNYLVLHCIDVRGNITRTIGYYVVAQRGTNAWTLHRHDSANGDSAAGALPEAGTAGQHRLIKRAVRLPGSGRLFTCARDRGVSVHGEFGTVDTQGRGRAEFIRCTLTTRS